MEQLKTNYKDDMFEGARRYRITQNSDGTSGITDATTYTQEGDQYGANDINGTNETVNALMGVKSVTLPTSGWTGSSAPYSQTVDVAGILATDTPVLIKMLTGTETEAAVKAYNKAFGFIFAGESGNGTVTFKAYKKPATDLTVGLKGV